MMEFFFSKGVACGVDIYPAYIESDIHRMTGLSRPRIAQTGVICKTWPWQIASAIRQSRNA
jgi:hypothetical protein